jgi:hypothetical protein
MTTLPSNVKLVKMKIECVNHTLGCEWKKFVNKC